MYHAKTAQNGSAWPAKTVANRKIAYLVNQYPAVSHSFIRREILALEKHGWSIFRIALRRWDSELVDPADVAECAKTTFVLQSGVLSLAIAVARQVVCAPRRFASALWLAMRMMSPSERPVLWHLIYLA